MPDFMLGLTVDTTASAWKLRLRLLDGRGGRRLDELQIEASPEGPGPSSEILVRDAVDLLTQQGGVRLAPLPDWYDPPAGPDSSDYLLRLEQQSAVRMVLAEILRLMREARPELLVEYGDRIDLLQRAHPLRGDIGWLINEAIANLL